VITQKGTEARAPMAITVIGDISTLLTLMLIPLIYAVMDQKARNQ